MNLDIAVKRLKASDVVTRENIQDLCVQISRQHNNLFLNLFTRCGKSRCIMRIVEDCKPKSILFINAQDLHIDNFKKDCEKYNHNISNYTLICWNSNKKYVNQHHDVIIIDEADNSLKNNLKFLEQVTYDKLIFLSATITKEQEDLIKEKINYYKFSLSLEEGMRWKIIPYPKIFLKRIMPEKHHQKIIDKFAEDIKYWGEKKNGFKCTIIGNKRKQYFEKVKMEWFDKNDMFQRLSSKRTLFFMSDIHNSKTLGNSISSLESKKENIRLLEKFNNGSIQFLIAKNILERGINVFNLNFAIFMTFKYKEKGLDQAFGRVLLGIAPNVIIPFIANSKEEKVITEFFSKLKCEIQYM